MFKLLNVSYIRFTCWLQIPDLNEKWPQLIFSFIFDFLKLVDENILAVRTGEQNKKTHRVCSQQWNFIFWAS